MKNNFNQHAIQPNPKTHKVGTMASIYKRKDGKGWRAVIRIKGYPTVCNHFERKARGRRLVRIEIERQIKAGQFKFGQHKTLHTFNELVDRYLLMAPWNTTVPQKIQCGISTTGNPAWELTPSFISIRNSSAKSDRFLAETPTPKGKKRTSALSIAISLPFLLFSPMRCRISYGLAKTLHCA